MTPTSSYGCDDSASDPEDEVDSAMIESAILEPRSPPQENRICSFAENVPELFRNSDPSHSQREANQSSSSSNEREDDNEGDGPAISSTSQAREEMEYPTLQDSEISILDIGPGLLNETP